MSGLMKYEVRKPDGKLIGTYWHSQLLKDVVLETMKPLKPKLWGSDYINDSAEVKIPSPQRLVLERRDIHWIDGSVIPTLVLVAGKQSWLKRSKSFRRAG